MTKLDESFLQHQLRAVRNAALSLRQATSEQKNQVLLHLSDLLKHEEQMVLDANAEDVSQSLDRPSAFLDRLSLDSKRLAQIRESLNQVASLPDPVNEVVSVDRLANGLVLKRTRAPLGVIYMIFESRPNVISEAFSLAFKAGNAILLKGGCESLKSAAAFYALITKALTMGGLDPNCLWGLTDPSRELSLYLMRANKWIDVLVPRGGDKLIEFAVENATIPIIKNDRGLCHVYVDEHADLKMAVDIVVNAKTQRPGVCNSMETLLVHSSIAPNFLPRVASALAEFNVEWFACETTRALLSGRSNVRSAQDSHWDTEHLDYKINCRVISSLEDALAHIERHGSRHSEAIITSHAQTARRFQASVDAAAVYWNASTRFTDGFEFGLGGELGISTQKLHVRGPVGLRELTSIRTVIDGTGQIR